MKNRNPHLKLATLEDSFSPKSDLKSSLSPELLDDIKNLWKEGKDAKYISSRYGLDVEQVERYVDKELVNKYRSRYQRLAKVFDRLYEATDLAHDEYMGGPTQGKSFSYTSLVNSLRGALVDLESLQNDADMSADIVKLVLNPLIRSLTRTIIDEMGSMKDELLLHYRQEDANKLINDATKRIGTHFGKGLDDAISRLERVLNTRENNRKKVLGGGKKEKKKGKKGKKKGPRSAKCDF